MNNNEIKRVCILINEWMLDFKTAIGSVPTEYVPFSNSKATKNDFASLILEIRASLDFFFDNPSFNATGINSEKMEFLKIVSNKSIDDDIIKKINWQMNKIQKYNKKIWSVKYNKYIYKNYNYHN